MAIKTNRKESSNKSGGTQTESTFILLPFDIKLQLVEQAKAEGRSLSAMGARIITAHFEKKPKA